MDDPVRIYVGAIDPRHRPLFDRIYDLVTQTCPEASLELSYKIPGELDNTASPSTGGDAEVTPVSSPGIRI